MAEDLEALMATPKHTSDPVAAREEDSARPSAPARWQRPSIRDLGSVRARVRGGGKSAANADSDPQSNTKGGVG